jgi:hypothetical protein
MIQSNDKKRPSCLSERDEARARLARQIGRLLAHEWLGNEQSKQTKPIQGTPASTACDAGGNDPFIATRSHSGMDPR